MPSAPAASSGCLVAALCRPPFTMGPVGLRPHNWARTRWRPNRTPALGSSRAPPHGPVPARGVDYLRLGRIHPRAYRQHQSFLTGAEYARDRRSHLFAAIGRGLLHPVDELDLTPVPRLAELGMTAMRGDATGWAAGHVRPAMTGLSAPWHGALRWRETMVFLGSCLASGTRAVGRGCLRRVSAVRLPSVVAVTGCRSPGVLSGPRWRGAPWESWGVGGGGCVPYRLG